MAAVQLKVQVSQSREIIIELPEDFPVGEAQVTVEPVSGSEEIPWEERPWTDEELDELLRSEPLPGSEIVARGLTGGWEDLEIEDSQAWVDAARRKRKEQRAWQQD